MNGDLNIFETVLYSAVVAQKAPQAKDQGSQQLCSNIDIYPEKKSERKKYRYIYNNFDHVRPIYLYLVKSTKKVLEFIKKVFEMLIYFTRIPPSIYGENTTFALFENYKHHFGAILENCKQ